MKTYLKKYLILRRHEFSIMVKKAKKSKSCYAFLAPYAILFFVFYLLPVCSSIFFSFTYYNILEKPRFIGLQNYINLILQFNIKPICVYSVTGKNSVNENGEETFGLLCFAEIREFSGQLDSEMEKVVLMDELPQNWTYPLIQPKLIEKYMQIEKQSYSQIQLSAKQTIEYIKNTIKPGMNLLEIRELSEKKLLELGADSFWYWDVGAFVFAGDETTVSVSGKQYVTSDRGIGNNDIITIDLSPQVGNIWGDYARTIIVENGMVVEDIGLIENPEWKSGLQMEEKLHAELLRFATKETTFEKLYYHMNEFIVENGFVNLDFMGNLGHSIVKTKGDRVYIEKGNMTKLGDVKYFTFEPHIAFPDSKYGYKKENIYYFNENGLMEL